MLVTRNFYFYTCLALEAAPSMTQYEINSTYNYIYTGTSKY